MKVLICTGIYPPAIGGSATIAEFLFKELPKNGIEVEVSSFDGVLHYPVIIRHMIYFFSTLKRSIGCATIMSLDAVSVGTSAWLIAAIFRKKLVVRIGGDFVWEKAVNQFGILQPLEDFGVGRYPLRIKMLRAVQSFVVKRADKIIVPSLFLKDVVSSWGVVSERIYVAHNNVALDTSVFDKANMRQKYNFSNFTIISSGRFITLKGFEALIDVVGGLDLSVKLYIIGAGPLEHILKQKIVKQKLGHAVIVLPVQPKAILFEMLSAADVFILNSLSEGCPNIVLEAMSAGTYVMAAKNRGVQEIISSPEFGYLFAWNDISDIQKHILTIYKQSDILMCASKNAKQSLSRFKTSDSLYIMIQCLVS